MRGWYAGKSQAERREMLQNRDPERVRAYDRARGGMRGRKPSEKQNRARRKVHLARKVGDLVPEPCLFCDDLQVVAHHHDYDLPLEVTWLCRHHHGRVHADEARAAAAGIVHA
ncbi:hypothetical protein NBH00_05055 [Paraconexibacter antarcticus]|uniref:HNH endonuclease n=1 Tax=Paraconexibacter antarcticus TaxID=2949664 RepID=A0ABY5DWB0_9ACTN|nr:hypothetical protein [Paraconexibacter antarcticus]UTI65578.1 hypothetical protein NBH00_05055 [Paraconexibacter antarcticus]